MKIKRIITLVLALVLCLGMAVPASAEITTVPEATTTMDAYEGAIITSDSMMEYCSYDEAQDAVVTEWTLNKYLIMDDDTVFTMNNTGTESDHVMFCRVFAYEKASEQGNDTIKFNRVESAYLAANGAMRLGFSVNLNQVKYVTPGETLQLTGKQIRKIHSDADMFVIMALLHDLSDNSSYYTAWMVKIDNEMAANIKEGNAPDHVHVYDQEIVSDEALKSEADCEDAAVYYLSCSCGKVSKNRNETFTYGEPLEHEEADGWKRNGEEHWKICDKCSEVLEDTREDHVDEDEDYECDVCERDLDEEDDENTFGNPFVDILLLSGGSNKAIEYVYKNGLFEGVSRNEFAPHMTMTRGMFVTVLGRMAGIDTSVYGGSNFSDVQAGEWYAPGVAWASQNGIVMGYGDGTFGVNDEITVEQAVVILARYAEFIGIDTASEYALTKFSDRNMVSGWALEQMQWAVEQGIYDGNGKSLVPQKAASRELVATLIYNFATEYVD